MGEVSASIQVCDTGVKRYGEVAVGMEDLRRVRPKIGAVVDGGQRVRVDMHQMGKGGGVTEREGTVFWQ